MDFKTTNRKITCQANTSDSMNMRRACSGMFGSSTTLHRSWNPPQSRVSQGQPENRQILWRRTARNAVQEFSQETICI